MPNVAASRHCSSGPSSRFVIPEPPEVSTGDAAKPVCSGLREPRVSSAEAYRERGTRQGCSGGAMLTAAGAPAPARPWSAGGLAATSVVRSGRSGGVNAWRARFARGGIRGWADGSSRAATLTAPIIRSAARARALDPGTWLLRQRVSSARAERAAFKRHALALGPPVPHAGRSACDCDVLGALRALSDLPHRPLTPLRRRFLCYQTCRTTWSTRTTAPAS